MPLYRSVVHFKTYKDRKQCFLYKRLDFLCIKAKRDIIFHRAILEKAPKINVFCHYNARIDNHSR